jgi:hypothetical protein
MVLMFLEVPPAAWRAMNHERMVDREVGEDVRR